jgi:hypothetical protein
MSTPSVRAPPPVSRIFTALTMRRRPPASPADTQHALPQTPASSSVPDDQPVGNHERARDPGRPRIRPPKYGWGTAYGQGLRDMVRYQVISRP